MENEFDDYDDDLSENDEFDHKFVILPSYIMLVIDTHRSLHQHTKGILESCLQVGESLIFNKDTTFNTFSICLTHKDQSLGALTTFTNNVLKTVQTIKTELLEDVDQKYAIDDDFDYSGFLSRRIRQFGELKGEFKLKKMIYVTNNDNPTAGNKNQRFAALNTFKLMSDNKIDFELVTFNPNFRYDLFYNDELYQVMNKDRMDEILIENNDAFLTKFRESIATHYSTKTCIYFAEGPIDKVDVRSFKVAKQVKLLSNASRYAEDDSEVIKENYFVNEDGKSVEESHDSVQIKSIRTAITVDKSDLQNAFLPNTAKGIYFVGTDIIRDRFGFVTEPLNYLQINRSMDDAKMISNFDQLWQYCIDEEKVLVCLEKKRIRSKIRVVELIAKVLNGERMFLVRVMPFANDIKFRVGEGNLLELEEEEEEAENEEVNEFSDEMDDEMIENMVEKLTFDFNPENFSDPSLHRLMTYMKSKFLDEDLIEMEEVDLVPVNAIDEHLGDLARDLVLKLGWKEIAKRGQKRAAAQD